MRAAERASRSKRMRNAGSPANRASMILMATGRSSRVSTPRYTVDMPPVAMGLPTR